MYDPDATDNDYDWNTPIEYKESDSEILPPGEYAFQVNGFERTVSTGAKTDGAKMAKVELLLYKNYPHEDDGTYHVTDYLILHKKTEWRIGQFFHALGLTTPGEKFQPRWDDMVGERGWVKVKHETYTKDGSEKKAVKVERYLDKPPPPTQDPWDVPF